MNQTSGKFYDNTAKNITINSTVLQFSRKKQRKNKKQNKKKLLKILTL